MPIFEQTALSSLWLSLALSTSTLAVSGASREDDGLAPTELETIGETVSGELATEARLPTEAEENGDLLRRVQQARKLAVERRKAVAAALPIEDLSREDLEIRGAERNISIYDRQLYEGNAPAATEAFRKHAMTTLASARRQKLARAWGDAIYHPESFDLLSAHARRMADLRRIRFFARVKGLSPLVAQSEALMQRAEAALDRTMLRLRDEARENPAFARVSIESRMQSAEESQP